MTIDDYIAALRQAIRVLPPEEIDQALAYYDEYLHDASDPAAAMAGLGTPKEVAASILASYVGKASSKPSLGVLWAVVLGVLAAPIAAPLAIGVLALLIGLIAVIFSLAVGGAAFTLAGAGAFVAGLTAISQGLSAALTLAGGGLLAAGAGLLFTFGIIHLARLGVTGLARLVIKLTRKSS